MEKRILRRHHQPVQQGTQQPVEGISGLPHGPGSGFSKYRPVWVAVMPSPAAPRQCLLNGFVHLVAADNQHMATPQKFSRHINPILMFGGNGVIEEVRQIEDGDRSG